MKRRIAFVAVGLALVLPAASAQAAFPGANGRIVFSDGVDILLIDPGGGDRIELTADAGINREPAWSPDAQKIAFMSDRDGNGEIYVMDANGQNETRVTTDPIAENQPSWSPDGQKIAFTGTIGGITNVYVANVNGTGLTNLTAGQGGSDPAWSPNGQKIAFISGDNLFTMNADGTGRAQVTNFGPDSRSSFHDPGDPDWSPDGQKIAYDLYYGGGFYFFNSFHVVNADGTGDTEYYFGDNGFPRGPAFSPDGAFVVFSCNNSLCIMSLAEGWQSAAPIPDSAPAGGPDWQPGRGGPLPARYPRPKGATPLRVPLVPAYEICVQPANTTHGSPLAWASCKPPRLKSSYATVGTPDSNGKGANSVAYLLFMTVPGDPATEADEADVRINATITDVRKRSDLSDYTGALSAFAVLQITDTNSPSEYSDYPSAGTVATSNTEVSVPCAPTASTTVGSTCQVDTSEDAIVPGAVKEGARAIWEVIDVRVFDGGADGTSTGPRTTFLDQGIFVP